MTPDAEASEPDSAFDPKKLRRAEVREVANALERAWQKHPHRGHAVVLIGAGCSISAGIPSAAETAKYAAIRLAQTYARRLGGFDGALEDLSDRDALNTMANAAVEWLQTDGRVTREQVRLLQDGEIDWRHFYRLAFDGHLVSMQEQHDVISSLVRKAETVEGRVRLNWAHACLGELVARNFVHTVLTTNFDQLALSAIIRAGVLPVVADGLSTYNRIVSQPPIPQLVHLHGSMHTYEMRNTDATIDATQNAKPAYSMMHNLLQQCRVLIVVGYSGADDGVMQMILDGAESLDGLVVYWVAYNAEDPLEPKVATLLEKHNKFIVDGGEADKFFYNVMQSLKISQPRWIDDPIAELEKQRDLLVASDSLDNVNNLIGQFIAAVDYAVGHGRDTTEPTALERASALRAAGDFKKAREVLAEVDLDADDAAAREDALNALELFHNDPIGSRSMLDVAIDRLKALTAKTSGATRLANLQSLFVALSDLEEALNDNGLPERDFTALEQIVAQVDEHLAEYDDNPQARSELLRARAAARQQIADHSDDIELMTQAVTDYRLAMAALGRDDASQHATEVSDGLAGALQVVGSKGPEPDVTLLTEAIELLEKSAARPVSASDPTEGGAIAYNLASAYVALYEATHGRDAHKNAVNWGNRARVAFTMADRPDRLSQVNDLFRKLEGT